MPVALFIGRFQPLHKGHIAVIRNLLKKYDKVLVGIGSAEKSRTKTNPFTLEERRAMLELVFGKEINEKKIEVIALEDKPNDEEWANYIIQNYQFDEVVTGSDWVAKCFEGKKPVKKIKHRKGEILNGTNIRRLMLEGSKEWEKLVDKKVANYIKEIALKNFLQSLPS